MTWANFYMLCFLVGFLWSIAALLMGHLHLGFHFHGTAPHAGLSHAAPIAHGHGLPHAGAHAGGHHALHANSESSISPLNFGTMAAFLTWFGGVGFLLTAYASLWFLWGLGLATLSGLGAASVLFWFLAKVLVAHEQDLNPIDYEMIGVLGRVSSPIRAGGTGEIVYSQEGGRCTSGARSEDGAAIAKGTEVVVTRYQKGIAYVRGWDEMTNGPSPECGEPGMKP
jgi:membrane protein implicated in regulation of membrane protease activity